jgi:hypothetical protein
MLYANGVPDVVGSFDPGKGKVQWEDGQTAGNYFGNAYRKVTDPQCSAIAVSLRSICTLSAIADSSGAVVLQNRLPGTRGNLGQYVIEQPGAWTVDASLGKKFRISESKAFTLRMDATNAFNHPQPANPNLDINSGLFGNIATKMDTVRTFQAQMRIDF